MDALFYALNFSGIREITSFLLFLFFLFSAFFLFSFLLNILSEILDCSSLLLDLLKLLDMFLKEVIMKEKRVLQLRRVGGIFTGFFRSA